MRRATLALAAAILTAAVIPVAAQPDTVTPDVRCLMIGMAMTNAPDPKIRTGGLMAIYYYLGRLDPKLPAAQLEARIRAEARAMTQDKAKADAQRCGQQLTARQSGLQAMAKRLAPPAPPAKGPPPKL